MRVAWRNHCVSNDGTLLYLTDSLGGCFFVALPAGGDGGGAGAGGGGGGGGGNDDEGKKKDGVGDASSTNRCSLVLQIQQLKEKNLEKDKKQEKQAQGVEGGNETKEHWNNGKRRKKEQTRQP
jgi:hypothetical protein